MLVGFRRGVLLAAAVTCAAVAALLAAPVQATPFTSTVPTTGVPLPVEYPAAGGVAIVLTGVNGNIYYQFSNPTGAFVGYQNTGAPAAFRGNPFTINSPIALDCGFRSCSQYFGGSIARIDIRFSAYDGDTEVGGFDNNDITLRINGFDVGNWSGRTTDITNDAGTISFGQVSGFGNNTFNTGWFASTNTALLANILSTGQTATQVYDRDPNDNYWDFTRGNSLPQESLRTIAPGYEFDKAIVGTNFTYATVGQRINYTYTVTNIGSVNIDNITVVDDRIANVSCPLAPNNSLALTRAGQGLPKQLVCTGSYDITQADIDAGSVTNVARANGTPQFGQLGAVSDTVTITGPVRDNRISLTKVGSPNPFGPVGSMVTYTFTARNDGNTTLSNVLVTDPRLPGQSCTFATILPLSATNSVNTRSCTMTYTVTQADIDAFAITGTRLVNTASVRATAPGGATVTNTAQSTLPGPVAVVSMTLAKSAVQADFDAVGDVINYRFAVRNTGNVTWPGPPAIVDTLTGAVSCPSGAVAPTVQIICTASYTILQGDLDAGSRQNSASATLTLAGQTATAVSATTLPAVPTTGLSLIKRLSAASPNPFTAINQTLVYEFVLRNSGNVSLSAVAVSDNTVGAGATSIAVTCPSTTLAPNATMICTSVAYSVTQADLDAGQVANTASAAATAPAGVGGGAVTSAPQTVTVSGTRAPGMSMDKTPPVVTALQFAGQPTVTYTYDVTNTGNVTIPGPITVTDNRLTPATFTCSPGSLAVGSSIQCTANYAITAADLSAGSVRNTAFATGTDGTQSNSDSAIIPQDGTFDFALTKDAVTTEYDAVGDTVDFTLTFSNTGDLTIFPGLGGGSRDRFVLSDPGTTFPGACTPPAIIYPVGSGQSPTGFTCTVRRTITQADIDAGAYTNTASLTLIYNQGTASQETQIVPPASATVPANVTPSFTIAKTSASTFRNVNDAVNYTFTVTNTSPQTLASVVLTDPLISTIACAGSATANTAINIPPVSAAPSNVVTCTGQYNVDQDDLDAGRIDNTVSALATTSTGATLGATDNTTVLIDPAFATQSLSLVKSTTPPAFGFTAPGQTIPYTFAVTNTGNLTLRNVVVTDAALNFTCQIAAIAPGMTDSTCTAQHIVTQADFDAGSYSNTASATADGVTPDANDQSTVVALATGPGRVASFTFVKTATPSYAAVGDLVDFTLSVENTGTVTLTDITLTDDFFDPDLTCVIPGIAPGAVDSSCTGIYQITQADIDAGEIVNNAALAGTGLDGAPIAGTADVTVPGPVENAAMFVTKVEVGGTGFYGNLPTTETYAFTLTNSGNVTLESLSITDPLTGFSCALDPLAPGQTATTCAGGAPLLQSTYTVDQDDIDAALIENTVEATGQSTLGTPVATSATISIQGPDQLPALALDKTSPTVDFAAPGDIIDYSYTVVNVGNVTLTEPVRVSDDRTTVACPALPLGGLLPMQSIICAATYGVTQADLDAGSVTNIATAAVTQRVQPSDDWPTGLAAVVSAPDTVTVTADQAPALSIVKRILPGTPSSFDGPGNLLSPSDPNNLTFEFIVRNSGNVTTTAPITVFDPLVFAVPVTCSTAIVPPGGTVSCTLRYAPTQADVDLGRFDNSATAATVFGGDDVTSAPANHSVSAIRRPSLEIAKQLQSLATFTPGEIATYRYDVTNTGNTTITAPITVNDNLIAGAIACGTTDLAPGESTFCTAEYAVSDRDLDFGSVTNSATGTNGTITSDPVSLTIPPGAVPTLSIVKVAGVTSFTAAGAVIPYTFTVSNTSSGSAPPSFIQPVEIIDDKITTPIICPAVSATNPLRPTDSIVCTGSYVVTQADVDAIRSGSPGGFVSNNAFARSRFAGEPISSPTVRVIVEATPGPALDVIKTAANLTDPGQPADVGDEIEFTIRAQNTGTQTLNAVVIRDSMLATLNCDRATPATLAPAAGATPGETLTCTGSYIVTQDDVDAGAAIANAADADATTTQGFSVSGNDATSYPVAAPMPQMSVDKTLIPGGGADDYSTVNETVNFRVTVVNTGNITLTDVAVTDDLVPGICTIGVLEPGDTDQSCIFDYVVQQTDIDLGTIANVATGTAQPASPGGTPLSVDDSLIINGPDREPQIGLSKVGTGPLTGGTGQTTFNAVGQRIDYVYTVANLGNVTLTQAPVIADNRIASVVCDPMPVGGLRPGDSLICRASDIVVLADLNAGEIVNSATATMPNTYGPLPLTATATETVTATRQPDLSVQKTASVDTDVRVGTEIVYTYTVQNPGNVTLTDVTLVDFHTSAAGVQQLVLTSGGIIATLDPGDVVTLTALYTVTQADIDAERALTNTVRATSTDPAGDPGPTAIARESVYLELPNAAMQAIKTLPTPPAVLEAGAELVFQLELTNIGNVTLSEPVLTDEVRSTGAPGVVGLPAALLLSGDTGVAGVFEIGEVRIYEVRYTLTQDDVDAGGISNTVLAEATDPQGRPVTDVSDNGAGDGDDPTLVSIVPAPAIETLKIVRTGPSPALPGSLVVFEVRVANRGNVSLATPDLTEDLRRADTAGTAISPQPGAVYESGDTDNNSSLSVGETWIYSVSHQLTQADIDAGGLENSVTAASTDPNDTPVSDVSDPATGSGSDPTPFNVAPAGALFVLKTVTQAPTVPAVDSLVRFRVTVANTGNVTLSAPTLTDTLTATGGAPLSLTPAYVGGDDGDTLIDPGEIWEYRVDYRLTQADIDAGALSNTARATALDPSGTSVADVSDTGAGDGDDPTAVPLTRTGAMAAIKTVASAPLPPVPGGQVVYTVRVANTGNVSLRSVTLVDRLTRADTSVIVPAPVAALQSGDTDNDSVLDVAEIWIYAVRHTLTQADIDAGGLVNTLTARATDPAGGSISDVSDDGLAGPGDTGADPTRLTFARAPALQATKTIVAPAAGIDPVAGVLVRFRIDIQNVGNVTLTGVHIESDTLTQADGTPLTLASGPTFLANSGGSLEGTLAVGETATFEARYRLTQADIDDGGISNQATAAGTAPDATIVTDISDDGDDTDGNLTGDPTLLRIVPRSVLTLDKVLTSGGPSVSAVGELLEYAFTVANTGNITVPAPITVSDPLIDTAGGAVTCPAIALLPGESLICTGAYSVTQADLDRGSVVNSATASGGGVTSAPDSVTVLAQQSPAMAVAKEAVSVTFSGSTYPGVPVAYYRVGAVVSYDYTVSNTGNTTITAPITIADNLIAAVSCPALPVGGLAPGASLVCTADYTVLADDVILTSVTNIATATDGTTTSDPVSQTVPDGGMPALTIDKVLLGVTGSDLAAKTEFDAPGDILTYGFTVSNIGLAAFGQDVVVIDTRIPGPIACFVPDAGNPDLGQGESVTCEAQYTVTQADLDAGRVVNSAYAQTRYGASRIVVSDPDRVVTTARIAPELTLTKVADIPAFAAPSDIVIYTLVATNTGNQTLSAVTVSDPMLGNLSCAPITLDPGAALTCSGRYEITQADIDSGTLTNTATVSAIAPLGISTGGTATLVLDGPAPAPGLSLVKTALPQAFGPAGSTLRYTLSVTNTGNVTLRDVIVSDPMQTPAYTCTIPVLAVGAEESGCGFNYTVTQDDADRGELTNTASVTGTPPVGAPVIVDATLVTTAAGNDGAIKAVKTAAIDGPAEVGVVVTFTLVVTNSGGVVLRDIMLADTTTRADGTILALDAPFARTGGDTDLDGLLDVGEAWTYSSRYTLTQPDIDAGGIVNTATVTGTGPTGTDVTDVSDDGDNTDDNTEDDPTEVVIARSPAIETIKSILTAGEAVGDEIVFGITATNTGNVVLTALSVADSLARLDGTDLSADVSAPVLVNGPGGSTGTTLLPGQTLTWEVRYTLVQADLDAGGIANSARAQGTDPTGAAIADLSDSPDPADGDGRDDPTRLVIAAGPAATLAKVADTPRRVGGTLFDIGFTITAENTGNVTLTNLSIADDLAAFAAPAQVVGVRDLTVVGLDQGAANAGFDGVGTTALVTPDAALAPGSVATVRFVVRIDAAAGVPAQPNTVSLGGAQLSISQTASAPIGPILPAEILVTKTVSPEDAVVGQTVRYTITMTNEGAFAEADLSLVDQMPEGLGYLPDSARLAGSQIPQPAVAGRVLTWPGISLAPGETIIATVQARVTEGPGEFVNRAWAQAPDGSAISEVATAALRVRPEAVFDCGDVIGRVFDDRNLNGYQDGPGGERIPEITDQRYDAEKYDTPEAVLPPGSEPGLAGVRVATVEGSIITTDAFGRYSVPCAALPADIGSNFTLKLDENSLPTGYHMTTENPRTLRLTPGTVTRMNFGAAISTVIDIDLMAEAFDGDDLSPALQQGVAGLVAQIRSDPTMLRLTYYRSGESPAVARARLDAVEELLRAVWAQAGASYTLTIERTITEAQ